MYMLNFDLYLHKKLCAIMVVLKKNNRKKQNILIKLIRIDKIYLGVEEKLILHNIIFAHKCKGDNVQI